jgi:hypothetical protein
MAKSTQVLTDATTVANGAPTSLSLAKAASPNGPIGDLVGNAGLILAKVKEIKFLANQVIQMYDNADPLKAVLQSIIDVMV